MGRPNAFASAPPQIGQRPSYRWLPDRTEARLAADQFRETTAGAKAGVSPSEHASLLGWRVEIAPLAADSDGQDALLIPSAHRSFALVIDPRPALREQWMRPQAGWKGWELASIFEFRVGHELGHTLFYNYDLPPRRLLPFTPEEERFCDAFSRALLLPPRVVALRPDSAQGIVAAAQGAHVCMDIVAAAFCDLHPGLVVLGGRITPHGMRLEFTAGHELPPANVVLPIPHQPRGGTGEIGPLRSPWLQLRGADRSTWWSDGHRALILVDSLARRIAD